LKTKSRVGKKRDKRKKRLQVDENTERATAGKKRSTENAEAEAQRPQRDTTPVAIERVWKLLRIVGIAARRCAKECVAASAQLRGLVGDWDDHGEG